MDSTENRRSNSPAGLQVTDRTTLCLATWLGAWPKLHICHSPNSLGKGHSGRISFVEEDENIVKQNFDGKACRQMG